MALQVVVRLRPRDFKDAGVDHIPLQPFRNPIMTQPGKCDLVIRMDDRTACQFIAHFFKDILQIKDSTRPELREGTVEWEIECWHWSLMNQGRELDRDECISGLPEEDYCFPHKVERARVVVLERGCGHVMQLPDKPKNITYQVRYFK